MHANKITNLKEIQKESLFTGINIISTIVDDVNFNLYIKYRPNSDIFYIFFPGAYDRKKGIIQFQRHSWVDHFDGTVLIFDDPTISDYNNLSIGWFQGVNKGILIPHLIKIIKFFSDIFSFLDENIILFGSSAGGFVALKLSEILLNSHVVCINPQINILKYHESFVEKMLLYSYGLNHKEKNIPLNIKDNLTISFKEKRVGKIFYFQNKADTHHTAHHLYYFLANFSKEPGISFFNYETDIFHKKNLISVIYYEDLIMGHRPPGLHGTLDFFNYIGY